jgi:hypothetical protein
MASRNTFWTDAEIERLRAFVSQGASIVRAAAALKRTTVSVRNQARKIGSPFLPLRVARRKWTDATN